MCSTHVCLWFEFLMLKKLLASLRFIFAHFPHQILWCLCPGTTKAFWTFFYPEGSNFRFSGFFFGLLNHCWSPGILTKLFSGPRFEICSASTELWFGNVFPDCLNLGWIFFLKLILRSCFGPRDIQIAFFPYNSTYRWTYYIDRLQRGWFHSEPWW